MHQRLGHGMACAVVGEGPGQGQGQAMSNEHGETTRVKGKKSTVRCICRPNVSEDIYRYICRVTGIGT